MDQPISMLNANGQLVFDIFQKYQNADDSIDKAAYLTLAEKKTRSKQTKRIFEGSDDREVLRFLSTLDGCKADADSMFSDLSSYLEQLIQGEFLFTLTPIVKRQELTHICVERRISTKATTLVDFSGNCLEHIHRLFDAGVVHEWLKEIYIPQIIQVIEKIPANKNVDVTTYMTSIRRYTACIGVRFTISVKTILEDDQSWLAYMTKVNRRISETFSTQKIFF